MALLENPAHALTQGAKTVAAAGTPERLSTDASRIVAVWIQAEGDNTGDIAVGDSSVDAGTNAPVLAAGESVTLNIGQLSEVYVDSTVNGDGVFWLALR